jgi:hypothetical protein
LRLNVGREDDAVASIVSLEVQLLNLTVMAVSAS